MSQEKVTRYKEEKANRKKIMKKEKRAKFLRNSVAGIICLAAVVWVGYSGVVTYIDSRPRDTVEVDYTAVNDYLNNLSTEAE